MPTFDASGQMVDPPAGDRTLKNVPKSDLRTPNSMQPFT